MASIHNTSSLPVNGAVSARRRAVVSTPRTRGHEPAVTVGADPHVNTSAPDHAARRAPTVGIVSNASEASVLTVALKKSGIAVEWASFTMAEQQRDLVRQVDVVIVSATVARPEDVSLLPLGVPLVVICQRRLAREFAECITRRGVSGAVVLGECDLRMIPAVVDLARRELTVVPSHVLADLADLARRAELSRLSPTQLAIVEELARGHSTVHAARGLGIAAGTVRAQLRRAVVKVGVANRRELITWYSRRRAHGSDY